MDLIRNAQPKPVRGSALLARKERRSVRQRLEQKEMQAAKKRDHGKCRWPNCQYAKKDIPIDAAHIVRHRGMGGNPDGDRTTRNQVAALCRLHHGLFDAAEVDIQPTTDAGTDGPMAFYTKDKETGDFVHIATETRVGVSVAVGA
jgi:hypothetical protein